MSISTTSLLSAETRLRLRREALRAALTDGRTRQAAWAASRLRLTGVELGPAEARAARAALVRFGRALRSARYRLAEPAARPATIAATEIGRAPRRRDRRAWIAVGLTAIAIGVLARPGAPAATDDGGAAPTVAAATPVPPIRGRTQPSAAPVVLAAVPVTVEPLPDVLPGPGAAVATEGSAPGGTGTTGPAVVRLPASPPVRTAAPRPTPTPTPIPTPTPTIAPSPPPAPAGPDGFSHVSGRVVDVGTGRPVANVLVCIANGDVGCTKAPRTDQDGRWTIVLTPTSSWNVQFIANGYIISTQPILPRVGSFLLPDIRLAPKG